MHKLVKYIPKILFHRSTEYNRRSFRTWLKVKTKLSSIQKGTLQKRGTKDRKGSLKRK